MAGSPTDFDSPTLAALAADGAHDLKDEAALRARYSPGPGETSLAKVCDHLHPLYRPYIEAAPFAAGRFVVDGQLPASVLVLTVHSGFFQCARAVKRSGLWDAARHVDRNALPSPGLVLQTLSRAGIDGAAYDAALPARQATTLY